MLLLYIEFCKLIKNMSDKEQMDSESVGCPIILGKIVKNWYKNYDVFYDHFSQSIIFHSKGKFYIQHINNRNISNIIKFNIGANFAAIFACALNHDGTMLACQPTSNIVFVFNNSQKTSPHGTVRKQYEIEEYKFEYKGIDKILGFSFANSTYFNFFICTNKEIEILNFNKFSSNVIHVKKIALPGEYLLYELQLYNILAVINSEGYINVVDFTKNPRTKTVIKKSAKLDFTVDGEDGGNQGIQSSRMSISDRAMSFFKSTAPTGPQFSACEPINNKNIIMYTEMNELMMDAFCLKEDNHSINNPSIQISIMYNIPYLIYMNCKLGKLDLYQLDVVNKTFIKFKECINLIPECMHKAHVIDNLLVVHNLDAQFSKLFDFSVKPITEAMCKNLPINSKFSADSFVCDGIQAHHEVDYVDEDDENIESLITGRKKFMFYDSPIISPLIDFSKPQGCAAGNVDDNDEDQAVNINIEFRYDNEYVEKIKVEEEKEVPKKDINVQNDSEYGVFSNVYSSDAVYVPDNIILDLEFGVSFGYMLSLF